MISEKLPYERLSRQALRDIIEDLAQTRREQDVPQYGLSEYKHHINDMPTSTKNLVHRLIDCHDNIKYYASDYLLKHTPEAFKATPQYLACLDVFMQEALMRKKHKLGYAWSKMATTEQMCIHIPDKDVRLAGLEVLISHNLGSRLDAYDIGHELCERSDCVWILRHEEGAYDMQSSWLELQRGNYCPVHSDFFYTDTERNNIIMRWNNIVEEKQK
ncbi:MAG: hypothetical protein V1725_00275 [archaeon]